MQREYWNKNANNKNFTTPLDVNRFQELVPKNALILDIGCGYGRTLADLYGLGYKRLIGVDTSIEMVKRGKNSYPYIDKIERLVLYCWNRDYPFDQSLDLDLAKWRLTGSSELVGTSHTITKFVYER